MQGIETTAMNFINTATPFVWIAVVIALLVNGLFMIVGGQEGREKAKKALPWVAIGCVIAIGAVQIGKWIASQVSF